MSSFLKLERTGKTVYFIFREDTNMFVRHLWRYKEIPVKTLTGGARTPSAAEKGKRTRVQDPASSDRCMAPASSSSARYLSLVVESSLACLRVDPQGNGGIEAVQLLGASHHQVTLSNLQGQPLSSVLGMR